MTESIIQHIENQKQPYRVPVFEITPTNIHFSDKIQKNASVVRLTTCDFITNYYNISYTNNCLRWIRIPEYENNDVLSSNATLSPTIPYYDISPGKDAMHLCKLYITPGAYESVQDVIDEINTKLYKSFSDIFQIQYVPFPIYNNQSFLYAWKVDSSSIDTVNNKDNVPCYFTSNGIPILKGVVIDSATIFNTEYSSIYYYIPGTIRFTNNNVQKSEENVIIEFTNLTIPSVNITNGEINLPYLSLDMSNDPDNPYAYNNKLQATTTDHILYEVYNTYVQSTFGHDEQNSNNYSKYKNCLKNVLRSFSVFDLENVNCNVYTRDGRTVAITKSAINIESATLQNFDNVSGILKYANRFQYSVNNDQTKGEFIYQYGFQSEVINPNLSIKIFIPDVKFTSEDSGTNGNYVIDLLNSGIPTITILNTNGEDVVCLSGYEIRKTDSNDYVNNGIFTGNLPTISFSSTTNVNIDTENVYNLTIELVSATPNPDKNNQLYAPAARIKKMKYISSSNIVSSEIPNVYKINLLNSVGANIESTTSWGLNLEFPSNEQSEGKCQTCKFFKATLTTAGSKSAIFFENVNGEITTSEDNLVEFIVFDRKFFVKDGLISSGVIYSTPIDVSIDKVFEPDESNSVTEQIVSITNNVELTYDTYYYAAYQLIKKTKQGDIPKFIDRVTANDNRKTYLKWFLPVIPVSSDTIYSSTLDFLKVMQDPNFDLKTTTLQLEPILSYTGIGGKQSLTKNNYKLTKYTREENTIDDYYYNFAIDKKDLWYKLGYTPCLINYTRDTIMNYNSSHKADESQIPEQLYPVYLIKGVYYSESLYNGPIYTPSQIKIDSYQENANITTVNKIILPEGYDITKLLDTIQDKTLFNTYFDKTNHVAQRLLNLSIPKTIEVKISQNRDVEEYLNSNEITDSIANLGQYQVVRDNEATIASIQQQLNINTTIQIPDNNPIYVYLTNGNQIYSLMDTVATLNVEFIN